MVSACCTCFDHSGYIVQAISPAAFLFAFCGEEKLVECMREKTKQQYNNRKEA